MSDTPVSDALLKYRAWREANEYYGEDEYTSFMSGWESHREQMNTKMPCGHEERYMVQQDEGTAFCALCELAVWQRAHAEVMLDHFKHTEGD